MRTYPVCLVYLSIGKYQFRGIICPGLPFSFILGMPETFCPNHTPVYCHPAFMLLTLSESAIVTG